VLKWSAERARDVFVRVFAQAAVFAASFTLHSLIYINSGDNGCGEQVAS
jgi:hypothetical protein